MRRAGHVATRIVRACGRLAFRALVAYGWSLYPIAPCRCAEDTQDGKQERS